MAAPSTPSRPPRDRTSQVVTFGLVVLALVGVATLFGESIVAFVDPAGAASHAGSPTTP